jgi:hypothetical protein
VGTLHLLYRQLQHESRPPTFVIVQE